MTISDVQVILHGTYVCGDGSAKVEIGSTSGNVRIEAAPEK